MSESALLATSTDDRPLLQAFDILQQRLPFAPLAVLPTPVIEMTALKSAPTRRWHENALEFKSLVFASSTTKVTSLPSNRFRWMLHMVP